MRLERSVFSIRPVELAFQARDFWPKRRKGWSTAPKFHQKIGLQSAQRRLQSGGKSTYSNSRATIPVRRELPGSANCRVGGFPHTRDGRRNLGDAGGASGSKERWRPPADIPESGLFPGTMTPSLLSAWSVARSSIPKSFATWRLKTPLEPKICRTIPR